MGRDEYSMVYNKYMVIGSKITVKYMLHSEANTPFRAFNIGVILDENESFNDTKDIGRWIEAGRCKYNVEGAHTGSMGVLPKIITKKFSAKKFFRVANPLDNIDTLGALVDYSPARHAFYDVFVNAVMGVQTQALYCATAMVTIDYICLMLDPKLLVQS